MPGEENLKLHTAGCPSFRVCGRARDRDTETGKARDVERKTEEGNEQTSGAPSMLVLFDDARKLFRSYMIVHTSIPLPTFPCCMG